MPRPIYESKADLDGERETARQIEEKHKCRAVKLPISYKVDWMLTRDGTTRAFAEIKRRKCESTTYPTLMLSLAKLMAGKALAKETGVPFILFAWWADGLFMHKVTDSGYTYGLGGRSDRNDADDIEPVVFIPTELFTKL